MMRIPHHTFLVLLLCAAIVGGGWGLNAGAQIVPIQPVATDETEIVVEGARYLRDRDVTVNVAPLQEGSDENGNPVYHKPGESDPLNAVYVLSTQDNGTATRYLPEHVGDASAVCPAEMVDGGTLQGQGATYVAVGPETDMTADQLTEVGSAADGATIYAYNGDNELNEILVAQSQGGGNVPLVRYMKIDQNSVPVSFGQQMNFAGQEFSPDPETAASLDGLTKAGCAGLFPVWAESAEAPFTTVTLQVSDRTVSFKATGPESSPSPQTSIGTPPPPATAAPPVATPPPATPAPRSVPPTAPAPKEISPTATSLPVTPTVVPPTATSVPPTAPAPTAPSAPPTATTAPPTPTAAPPTATVAPPTATSAPAGSAADEPALPTAEPATPGPGTPVPTLPPARPTPTQVVLQPAASISTPSTQAPSPAAVQVTGVECTGATGALDASGIPALLPRNIQYGGASYRYSGKVASADIDTAVTVGCAGPFAISVVADDDTAIYLGLAGTSTTLYQFEKTRSFTVRSEVTNQPRAIQTAGTDEQPKVIYRAGEPLTRSAYSSLSLVLYVEDASNPAPDRLYGYAVGADMFGVYATEGSAEQAPQDVLDRAEASGIHGELQMNGQRYVLTSLWLPYGTTTNGWVTLYGAEGDPVPATLLGLDPRQPDLQVFDRGE